MSLQELKARAERAFQDYPYETHQLFLRNYLPFSIDPAGINGRSELEYSKTPNEGPFYISEELYDKAFFLALWKAEKALHFELKGESLRRHYSGEESTFTFHVIRVSGKSTVLDELSLLSGLHADVTVFIVESGSVLSHYRLLKEPSGHALTNTYYILEEGASAAVYSYYEGSGQIRDHYVAELRGHGGSYRGRAGYMLSSGLADSKFVIRIEGSSCEAETYQRASLHGASRALQKGLVINERSGSGSRSYMEQRALVFSREATVQNIPGMELESNDISAKHAASSSPVQEEQLFYMMSRGLSREASIGLLSEALLAEIKEAVDAALGAVTEKG